MRVNTHPCHPPPWGEAGGVSLLFHSDVSRRRETPQAARPGTQENRTRVPSGSPTALGPSSSLPSFASLFGGLVEEVVGRVRGKRFRADVCELGAAGRGCEP